MKDVFVVIQKNGNGQKKKSFWQKVGVAFDNKDGSMNVLLNCIPMDGRLHIREPKPKGQDTETSNT